MDEIRDDKSFKAAQRKRSIALAIVLALFALSFYALTIVKMGPGIFDRSL